MRPSRARLWACRRLKPLQLTLGERRLDAILDMACQNLPRSGEIPAQGAAHEVAVLSRRDPSPVDVADHLITQILVVDRRVGLEQNLRTARRDERRVELAVVAL